MTCTLPQTVESLRSILWYLTGTILFLSLLAFFLYYMAHRLIREETETRAGKFIGKHNKYFLP